ncbi:DCC family protein At1g52590, chloroplastic isoform X2 [Nicotiana tabacum]|uniref:DCC family protein At1g52590, chloroplastic isoform X2 n=1 Tax=Nicotiana tabacum TaxID=4097 RepID=A0AC58UDR2_TOBAC
MNMAFTAPARFAGLTVTPSAHARFRRQFTPFATLSTPPTTSSSSRETVDWVKATASFFEGDNRPIMLFDGVCNLCNGGVKFVRDNDSTRSYVKSEAVLKIMEYINLPFPQLAFFLQFVPLFIRDFAYDNVANNRYALFGRSDSCEI